MGEQAEPYAHLDRVDARIEGDNVGVRDVKPAHIDAHVMPAAHYVRAQSRAGREIERRAPRRHRRGGEQSPAADLQKWRDVAARAEIPLQGEGIEAAPVNRAGALEN